MTYRPKSYSIQAQGTAEGQWFNTGGSGDEIRCGAEFCQRIGTGQGHGPVGQGGSGVRPFRL